MTVWLTPSNRSYFRTHPIKPSSYLYFSPQLVLSAAVLFPEPQRMMMITFIDSLYVGYGLGQRNALCLSFENISLFWNDFPMVWDLGASLKRFLKHWPWHRVLCFIWDLSGSSGAFSFPLLCYILHKGFLCVPCECDRNLGKESQGFPSISNTLFCFPLFSTFSLCTLPLCVILGIFEALRIVVT